MGGLNDIGKQLEEGQSANWCVLQVGENPPPAKAMGHGMWRNKNIHMRTSLKGFVTSVLLAAFCFLAPYSAFAQSDLFSGSWASGRTTNDSIGNECVLMNTVQFFLDLEDLGQDRYNGYLVQDHRREVLGRSGQRSGTERQVNELCSLQYTSNPRLGAQTKYWIFSGRADGSSLQASTTSAECKNDWCETVDPRMGSLKPGATNFDTRFVLRGDFLIDTYGTDSSSDDVIFVRRDAYENRASEGAAVAESFLGYLARNDIQGAMAYVSRRQSGTNFNTLSNFSAAMTNDDEVQSFAKVVQFLSTIGQPEADGWAIRFRLIYKSGRRSDVVIFLSADQESNPTVTYCFLL